jgi:hypothetical protein
VSDEVRKRHPYRRKDIERYRSAFSVLKADIDLKAEADATESTPELDEQDGQAGQDAHPEGNPAAPQSANQANNQ